MINTITTEELNDLWGNVTSYGKLGKLIGLSATQTRGLLIKRGLLHITYRCKVCYTSNPSQFNPTKATHICKPCKQRVDRERVRAVKRELITMRGGGCEICGYSTCISALEWHHRDPSAKSPKWGWIYKLRRDVVLAEIAKCDLLCSNCHRETHSIQYNTPQTITAERVYIDFGMPTYPY